MSLRHDMIRCHRAKITTHHRGGKRNAAALPLPTSPTKSWFTISQSLKISGAAIKTFYPVFKIARHNVMTRTSCKLVCTWAPE